jgi:hypothetical protein
MKTIKPNLKPTIQLNQEDWQTMERDVSLAHEVITRHHDGEEGHLSVYLQEATISLEGSIDIKRAGWVIELQEQYELQYGEERGDEVLKRVLTALLTHGMTIH